jgi:glutathione peroxidase
MSQFYNFEVKDASGATFNLHQFMGKPLIVVNTASKCGFTPQFAGLQELYDHYQAKGLNIIGFPCDQFLHQEPNDASGAAQFCQLNYGVSFPIVQKIEVNGPNAHPLFNWLKEQSTPKPLKITDHFFKLLAGVGHTIKLDSKDIRWNFTKFLLNNKGEVVERFEPYEEPKDMLLAIKTLLNESSPF